MPTTLQCGLEEFWTAACIWMQSTSRGLLPLRSEGDRTRVSSISNQWKNRFVAWGWRRRGRVKSVVPLTEKSRVQGLLSRLGPQAGPRLRTNVEGFADVQLFNCVFVFFFTFYFTQFFSKLLLP